MAQVILGAAGGAVGGPIGAAVGSALGAGLDSRAVGALAPMRRRGPRLPGLRLQSTAEGTPVELAFGRVRVAGQVIWAARFRERASTSGAKGARVTQNAYSLSFAVGLCEGPIDGVGRVWADGKAMDLSGVAMRVYRGTEDQTPDALIEAVEGAAPAYRGTAYVVFEDLPLGPYGNRPPQLSFEVFRRPRGADEGLEDRLTGVCLIPGAGEFVYATTTVLRREGLTSTAPENVHNGHGQADLAVSLDQLQAQLPGVRRVNLVISWFGDDLRCGECRIRPGVESAAKATSPIEWSVADLERGEAHPISGGPDAPNYGGTPSDASVREAVAALKARGYAVTLYPFLMMDVPAGNALPDPHGAAEQAAFPWRGRITCHPAPGRPGSPDRSAMAEDQVEAFFDGAWGWRRMVLHYAALAAESGADGLLIGSELRGLTTARGAGGSYPAVEALRALAADCRAVVGPGVELSYAADWSEYFGHQPADGSGDVAFHLDSLWSDPDIDYVGVDWYPPLSDWRDGDDHLDAAPGRRTGLEPEYLAANVAGGEGFDWFYASEADRAAQARTPITDGAYGEPWVFRPKDLAGWWSHPHHDRPGGVRNASPTGWTPEMKPVRFVEFGCPAVDKGPNAPNLFVDPKSSETGLPPFSNGVRSDLAQRRALEALLGWFAQAEHNPASGVYGGPMLSGMDAWCWDARPFPDFPARGETWADADAWATGHWLNGRMAGEGAALISALLDAGGLEADDVLFERVEAAVDGYLISGPTRLREALEPLLDLLDVEVVEREARLAFLGRGGVVHDLGGDDLAMPEEGDGRRASRRLQAPPQTARARFIDAAADYALGSVTARSEPAGGGSVDVDLPAVIGAGQAEAAALRLLARAAATGDGVTVDLSPLRALTLEAGDLVSLNGADGPWRVTGLELDEPARATLEPVPAWIEVETAVDWRPGAPPPVVGPPWLEVLDLPPIPGAVSDRRPWVAAARTPFTPTEIFAGAAAELLTPRGTIASGAVVGVLTSELKGGAPSRWDEVSVLTARFEGGAPQSVSKAAVLAGANLLAVRSRTGEWELLQHRDAQLQEDGGWRLSGLLRGRAGTDEDAAQGAEIGAPVVVVASLARVEAGDEECGLPLMWRAAPAGGPAGGPASAEAALTWRGLWRRPWAPAHLRARGDGAGLEISWVRRARLEGDSWEGDTPLGEEVERYRVEVLDGAAVVRTAVTMAAIWSYPAADLDADFPGGLDEAALRVAQWSASWGWGRSAAIRLGA